MSSFHIEQKIVIKADPERVFDALTKNVGSWWSKHFSKEPKAIKLESEIGGRFYEEFGEGGSGALFAFVSYIDYGKALILTGPMGMTAPVLNFIQFELEPQDGSTLLRLSHKALGEVEQEVLSNYEAGWQLLLGKRLKPFVEDGKRYDPTAESQ